MSTIEFNQAVVGLQKPLEFYALSLTKNMHDAEDLLQETLFKALNYRDRFADSTNLKAWMYTIMKNSFINAYRRKVRANTLLDSTEEQHFINSKEDFRLPGPESVIAHRDIRTAIDTLSDEMRKPFMMHYEGYKYHEIAEEMDLPIGTVKSRIFLARKKLMNQLKDFRS